MNIPEPQDLPTLCGARVKLRPPVERDKEDRLAAGRDPEFRRVVGGDPTDCPPLILPEVEQRSSHLQKITSPTVIRCWKRSSNVIKSNWD